MATGVYTDMKIYEEQFNGGMFERVSQALDIFGPASNGSIVIEPSETMRGNFEHESFYLFADGFRRRTIASVADISDVKLAQEEQIAPKVSWADGPYADTEDAFKKIGATPDEMSYVLGQQAGEKLIQAYVNAAAAALRGVFAATGVATTLVYDASALSAGGTANFINLTRGLAKMGDASQQIVAWLMHSTSFYHLIQDGITNYKIDTIAGNLLMVKNLPAALGRPIIVTDSPQLYSAGTSASNDQTYNIYGLVPGAVSLKDSEERGFLLERVGGKQNLVLRYQSEGAFTLRVKGMKFSTSDLNPSDATLATAAKWTKSATSVKSLPGVCVKVDAS